MPSTERSRTQMIPYSTHEASHRCQKQTQPPVGFKAP